MPGQSADKEYAMFNETWLHIKVIWPLLTIINGNKNLLKIKWAFTKKYTEDNVHLFSSLQNNFKHVIITLYIYIVYVHTQHVANS